MRRTDRRRTAGFTLIELLVAIGLLSIVLTVTYGAVSHAVAVRRAVTNRGAMLRAATAFFDRLERELGAAYAERVGSSVGGLGGLGPHTVFLGLDNEDVLPRDGLAFVCNCNEVWTFGLEDANGIPHLEVAYDFVYDTDRERTLLFRRADPTLDTEPRRGGFSEPLWEVIRGWNLRYLDPVDRVWKDSWDAAATPGTPLPRAVEVTLWLADPELSDDEARRQAWIVGRTIPIPGVRKQRRR